MGTKANLELRIGTEVFQVCTYYDGYNVYKMIPELADYLENQKKLTNKGVKSWFESTSKKVFGEKWESGFLDPKFANEVVIDLLRRIVLHTGTEEDLGERSILGPEFSQRFLDAVDRLSKLDYQVLKYDSLFMLKWKRENPDPE